MNRALKRRRDYQRGYYHGRKNTPFTMVPKMNPDVARGWGTAQAKAHDWP